MLSPLPPPPSTHHTLTHIITEVLLHRGTDVTHHGFETLSLNWMFVFVIHPQTAHGRHVLSFHYSAKLVHVTLQMTPETGVCVCRFDLSGKLISFKILILNK